tara:strand:- start:90977 stop:91747 length:771 start_codon:yes stop_codon:yes gene_type:complete
MSPVIYSVEGDVATITLDDKENRNALGNALTTGIYQAITSANTDPNVRALVLTHKGNVFCAGANLKERSIQTGQVDQETIGFDQVLELILKSPKPVIAKISGAAMGGGIGLACAADISIATKDAKFGFTEVRLGVAPAIISVVCLAKMRRGEAMEAFLRGNKFSGVKAAELGIISRAVEAKDLDNEIQLVLEDILHGGPLALAAAKRLINEIPEKPTNEAFPWAAEYSNALFNSEEAAEGMAAFLEKRSPNWVTDK